MTVRYLAKKHVAYTDLLADDECPFSSNRVTGHSLNFPIVGTCTPTVVCGETCYFAKGPSTWTPSLKKQHRLMNSIKADPDGMAARIASGAPVVFRNCYDAAGEQLYGYDCPLNGADDITGVCGGCRRCFDGTAVREARECHWRPPSPSGL